MKFSPEFLPALSYAHLISESLFQKGSTDPGVSFEIYPYPAKGPARHLVSEILIDIGGKVFSYQMSVQDWEQMKWPGGSGVLGAVLQVREKGKARQTQEYKGWWGLFRMLDASRLTKLSSTVYHAEWDFKTPEANELQVQYDLRANSHKNPFDLGFFSHFRCATQL